MNRKMNIFLILVLFASTCLAQVATSTELSTKKNTSHVFCFTNPITRDTSIAMRDHCIIKVGNKWYCTGTSLPV